MNEEYCSCSDGPMLQGREHWAKPRCRKCKKFVFNFVQKPKAKE